MDANSSVNSGVTAFAAQLDLVISMYENLENNDKSIALQMLKDAVHDLPKPCNIADVTDVSSKFECQEKICTNCSEVFNSSALFTDHIKLCFNEMSNPRQITPDSPSLSDNSSRRSRRKRANPRRVSHQYKGDNNDDDDDDEDEDDNNVLEYSSGKKNRKVAKKPGMVPCKVVKDFKGDERFQCNQCELKFSYYAALLRHLDAIHGSVDAAQKIQESNKKAVSCAQCGAVLSSKGALHAHMQKHTGVQPYSCDVCKKKFSLKSNLFRHQRIHQGLKPYECDICLKRFTEKRSVEVHRRIHTGEKPYNCDVCGMKFSQLGSWLGHKDTHKVESGDNKYECDECGKVLTQKVGLYNHKRRHHDKLRFHKCEYCEMSFFTSEELRLHTRTHTGQKPFLCPKCGKTFARLQTYKNHMNQHLDQNPFHCPYCSETFTTTWAFSRHKKSHIRNTAQEEVVITSLDETESASHNIEMLPKEVLTVYCLPDSADASQELLETLTEVHGLQ